jgi:hypothetical protein
MSLGKIFLVIYVSGYLASLVTLLILSRDRRDFAGNRVPIRYWLGFSALLSFLSWVGFGMAVNNAA